MTDSTWLDCGGTGLMERTRNCLIFQVEDSDEDAFLFERALNRCGYLGKYVRVASIEAAKTFVSTGNLLPEKSVVVTDSRLPDGAAHEFVRWFRDFDVRTPVLVHSGSTGPLIEESCAAGATEVIGKGVSSEDFLSSVRRLVAYCHTGRPV